MSSVHQRRGTQARANLNGGELDEEPSLRDDGQYCDRDIKEDAKIECAVPGPT